MKHLADNGCVVVRDSGPHTIVRNTNNDAHSSVPRHREIKTTTARRICQQLSVPPPPER
jgi:hypothetical protein